MRRGRRPLRWLRDAGISGAVRHSFSYPLRFYAATSVTLLHVGCTVLGAPRPRDRWVALDAVVRPDRFYPRFPRRANLASTTQHMQSRGHSPRTISCGRPRLSVNRGRAGVEDKPLRREWGRFQRATGVVRRPKAGRRGRRPLRAVCILHVAAYNVRAQPAHHLYVAATASVIPRREGVEDKPLRRECEGVRAKPAV